MQKSLQMTKFLIYRFYSPKIQWLNLGIETTKFFVGYTSSVDPFARISLFEAHFPSTINQNIPIPSLEWIRKRENPNKSLAWTSHIANGRTVTGNYSFSTYAPPSGNETKIVFKGTKKDSDDVAGLLDIRGHLNAGRTKWVSLQLKRQWQMPCQTVESICDNTSQWQQKQPQNIQGI